MNTIQQELNPQWRGAFYIEDNHSRVAEMAIGIEDGNLTVYHTEVSEKLKGQGIASSLLEHMVQYAREHKLKVIALCPYVLSQFKKRPTQYADVWNQKWHP